MKKLIITVGLSLLTGHTLIYGQNQPANPAATQLQIQTIEDKEIVPDAHKHPADARPKRMPANTFNQVMASNEVSDIIRDRFNKTPVLLPIPSTDKIVIKLMFQLGSICDPPGKEGLTNIMANLMVDGGTPEMTRSQLRDFLYPTAASSSVSVDKEITVFTFEFHRDHFDLVFHPLMKLVVQPRFDEKDFNRILSNAQNYTEQVLKASSDEDYSKIALENLLFRGTNYAHPVTGTISGLSSITLQDVKSHHRKWITSGNMLLGLAGNFNSELLSRIQKMISLLPSEQPEIPIAGKARAVNGIEVEIISKKGAPGSAIYGGVKFDLTRSDDDFAAMMVANSWLGEHRKSYSRLYQKIREQRSMNYGDYTYIEWYQAGGSNMLPLPGYPRSANYFSIWIRPVQTAKALREQYPELGDLKTGHAHFAIRMALREWDLLVSKGMTKEDFELTRQFLKSYIKLYIQTPAKQLGFLMDSRFYGRQDFIHDVSILLDNLTVEQVNKAMKKYWNPGNLFISIITDESEAENLKTQLLTNAPSPMTYPKELKSVLSREILDEDAIVEKYPLKVRRAEIILSDDFLK